ncbi:MAG: hypothetical protein P1U56_08175 [Saprospiraceae bacterium]|nr:hypothetical protein [Saprospiraceae bacterium]
MNTTKKYILGKNEIDPLTFKEVGTSELELVVTNEEIDSFILSRYKLDRFGRLQSSQRKELEWTAFPSINGAIRINDKEKIKRIGFSEQFEYNSGELKSTQLINIENQKLISKVDYKFEHSNIVEINQTKYRGTKWLIDKQLFIYNAGNSIIQIQRKINIDEHSNYTIDTNFIIDDNGRVTEKQINHTTSFGDSIISVYSKEVFKYNIHGQLIESIQTAEDDNQTLECKVKFQYLSNNYDLISKIRTQEEDKPPTIKEYMYDDARRLTCIKIENCGNVTATNYNRCYRMEKC